MEKEILIFENVGQRIEAYDERKGNPRYNCAYCQVLEARAGRRSLVERDGSISQEALKVIELGLKSFNMARTMRKGSEFRVRLEEKLSRKDIKDILGRLIHLRIELPEWMEYRADVQKVYHTLSERGPESLSAKENHFDVGATKVMNFLFPELFIIVDSHVAEALIKLNRIKILGKGKTYQFSFEIYWQIMQICYQDLEKYRENNGDVANLLKIGNEPTTLTRIFDKCLFKRDWE